MFKTNVSFITEGTMGEQVNPINNTYFSVLVKLLVFHMIWNHL